MLFHVDRVSTLPRRGSSAVGTTLMALSIFLPVIASSKALAQEPCDEVRFNVGGMRGDIEELGRTFVGVVKGILKAELHPDSIKQRKEPVMIRGGDFCRVVVPRLTYHRPVYFVEVTPQAGKSDLLPGPVGDLSQCLISKLDEWLMVPLFKAATDPEARAAAPRLYGEIFANMPSGRRGPSRRGSSYEVHVFKFQFDPLVPLLENSGHPNKWLGKMVGAVEVKPCYFSELDPLRWRFGVPWPPTEEELRKTYRFWEGMVSGEPSEWLPWAPLNTVSGRVAHSNPLIGAMVDAVRGSFYATRGGLGSLCRGEAEEIFSFAEASNKTPADVLKEALGRIPEIDSAVAESVVNTLPADYWERSDVAVEVEDLAGAFGQAARAASQTPEEEQGLTERIRSAYVAARTPPGALKFSRNLSIQMVYPETWDRPRLIGTRVSELLYEPQPPSDNHHYAFLIWKETRNCLAGELGRAALDLARKLAENGLEAIVNSLTGGAGTAAVQIAEAAEIASEFAELVQEVQDATAELKKLKEQLGVLLDVLEEMLKEAQRSLDGVIINGAIMGIAGALGMPEAAGYVYTAECALDTGWKALDTVATLGSFDACGHGLSDAKALKKPIGAIQDARDKVAKFIEEPPLNSALPQACMMPTVEATIRKIHHGATGTSWQPQAPSVAYVHQKAQLLADVGAGLDLACTGVKLIKDPPRNCSDLAGAFAQVPTPNSPRIRQAQEVLATIENLRNLRELDTALSAARVQRSVPAADVQSFVQALETLQKDLRALNVVSVGDVRKAVAKMGSADFLAEMGQHVEVELKQFVEELKKVGFPDNELKKLQSSGKGVIRSAKQFFGLMKNVSSAGKEEIFEGIIALGAFSEELEGFSEELAANSADLQTRVQQAVDLVRDSIKPLASSLADHIRDIPDAYAAQIESTFQVLPTSQIATIAADLRRIESEGLSLGAQGYGPAAQFGRTAGALAVKLESLPSVTMTAATLGPALDPVRGPIETVAVQVEELGDKLKDLFDRLLELAQSLGIFRDGGATMVAQTNGLFNGEQERNPNDVTLARVIASIGMFAKLQSRPDRMLAAARKMPDYVKQLEAEGVLQEERIPRAYGRAVREQLKPHQNKGETPEDIEKAAADEFKRNREMIRPFPDKDLDKPHPATGLTQRQIQEDPDSPVVKMKTCMAAAREDRDDPGCPTREEFRKSRCELQKRLAEGRGAPPPAECK